MVAVILLFVRVFPTLHRRAGRPRGVMSPAPAHSTCWIWASCSARPSLAPTFPSTHQCCLSCACHCHRRAEGVGGGPAVPLTLTSEQGAAFQSGRALGNMRGTLGRGGHRSCSVFLFGPSLNQRSRPASHSTCSVGPSTPDCGYGALGCGYEAQEGGWARPGHQWAVQSPLKQNTGCFCLRL